MSLRSHSGLYPLLVAGTAALLPWRRHHGGLCVFQDAQQLTHVLVHVGAGLQHAGLHQVAKLRQPAVVHIADLYHRRGYVWPPVGERQGAKHLAGELLRDVLGPCGDGLRKHIDEHLPQRTASH